MTSTEMQPASITTVAQEVLQLICRPLSRLDLKSMRLVSREINNAAEVFLFRQIFLRRNMDSFCKLRMITSRPHLAKLVKALAYSGMTLRHEDDGTDFDTWFQERIRSSSSGYQKSEDIEIFREQFTLNELHQCYEQFCRYYHSEELMQLFDIEDEDLIAAFGKLPHIEEISFGHDYIFQCVASPLTLDSYSSVGREMLVDPTHVGGRDYHVGQFTALLMAAHKNRKRIKVIEGLGLQWEALQQSDEISTMMIASMKHCEHFALEMSSSDDKRKGEAQVASMLSNAPYLRIIEIYFGDIPMVRGVGVAKKKVPILSRLFPHQKHWPNLATLKLQGIVGSDVDLKELLAAHAATLRSLDLSHIELQARELEGKVHHGSWVVFFLFLHDALNLQEMRFQGLLSNQWNETWNILEPEIAFSFRPPPPEHYITFKQRMERFVVEGGDFPLPWPTETEGSRWKDTLLDFRPNLDMTWQFRKSVFREALYALTS